MASCVAVTTAISLMMQNKHIKKNGQLDVEELIGECYRYASHCLIGRPKDEVNKLFIVWVNSTFDVKKYGIIIYYKNCKLSILIKTFYLSI